MKTPTVVTNLRVKKSDWEQIKTAAAELGMSFNEYMNYIIREKTQSRELGLQPQKKRETLWNAPEIKRGVQDLGEVFSDDDLAIYGG